MPSVPVFQASDAEKTPLLLGGGEKPRRKRTVSSPDLLTFNSPVPPLPIPPPTRERRVSLSSANLTTIHEADENEDFDSSTAIINTPRSGTFPPWNFYSLGSYHGRMRGRKRKIILWTSFVLSGILISMFLIMLPVCLSAGMRSGSDAYVAMFAAATWFPIGFFVLLLISKLFIRSVPLTPRMSTGSVVGAGILLGITHSGLSISCLPERTQPVFQPLQLTLALPVWMVFRVVVQNESSSTKMVVGTMLTLGGVACAMVPGILVAADVIQRDSDVTDSWVHPFVLALSSVAFGLYLGCVEKMSSRQRTDLFTTVTWTHVVSLVTQIVMLWVNFLPVVGMMSDKYAFVDNLTRGFNCFYDGDDACADLSTKGGLFIGSYLLGTYFLLLLIRATQGSTSLSYMALALVVTTTTICWLLFNHSPTFRFDPDINSLTLCILAGGIFFVLATVLFTMVSVEQPRPTTPCNSRLIHFRYQSPGFKTDNYGTVSQPALQKVGKSTLTRVKSSPSLLTF